MSTTQPEELKTIQQQVEDARNVLTITEQNTMRLQRLHQSEEYALSELVKAKAAIQEDISRLDIKKKNLIDEINNMLQVKQETITELEQAKKNFNDVVLSTDKKTQECDIKVMELTILAETLTKREADVLLREQTVNDTETSINEKHEKLRQFIKSI